VFLHPRMKWLWFEKRWETNPLWIVAAHEVVNDLWQQYKDTGITPIPIAIDDDEDWLNAPDPAAVDRL
jgi:hypothetical protein